MEPGIEDEDGEGAQGQELAVGEVRQAGRAEDEVEAEGAEGDQQREDEAVEDELEDAIQGDVAPDASAVATTAVPGRAT